MQIKILCLALCMINIYCKDMLYVGGILPISFYQCFRQTGYDQIILPLPLEDQLYAVFVDNIIKAKNAGLKVHIVYPVCRNKSYHQLAQQLLKLFGNNAFQNVWLFAEWAQTDPQCPWDKYSVQSNCQFARQFLQGLNRNNINGNVMIEKEMWAQVFGSVSACPELGRYKSWWSNLYYDFQPNFDNYQQIGGWKKPFMKLYSYMQVCGYPQVLVNYYE